VACKILDRRIGGKHPAVFVACESNRVVHVHLDEVLVEAIVTPLEMFT
jgi:hypothetical protein